MFEKMSNSRKIHRGCHSQAATNKNVLKIVVHKSTYKSPNPAVSISMSPVLTESLGFTDETRLDIFVDKSSKKVMLKVVDSDDKDGWKLTYPPKGRPTLKYTAFEGCLFPNNEKLSIEIEQFTTNKEGSIFFNIPNDLGSFKLEAYQKIISFQQMRMV